MPDKSSYGQRGIHTTCVSISRWRESSNDIWADCLADGLLHSVGQCLKLFVWSEGESQAFILIVVRESSDDIMYCRTGGESLPAPFKRPMPDIICMVMGQGITAQPKIRAISNRQGITIYICTYNVYILDM